MVLSADILFVSLLYFLVVSVFSASADQQEIKARSGDDVTLQCRGPTDASIILLEWNRPDLSTESYVFFYRNERSYENYQLPSFRGRVELSDPEMKNGDASVVLKNVTVSDSGTYECQVTISTLELNEIKHSVGLTVTDSDDTAGNRDEGNRDEGNRDEGNRNGGNEDGGNKDGYLGVICASSVMGVLLAIVSLGVMIYRKRSNRHSVKKRPNDDVVI